jgi:hypothetical protein
VKIHLSIPILIPESRKSHIIIREKETSSYRSIVEPFLMVQIFKKVQREEVC